MSVKTWSAPTPEEETIGWQGMRIAQLENQHTTLLTRHNALRERFTEMHQSVEYCETALYERTLEYNALVEAVAWYLECDSCPLKNTTEAEKHGFAAIWATRRAARAEVDRLIGGE